jgi:hypothetical protein
MGGAAGAMLNSTISTIAITVGAVLGKLFGV